MSRIAIVGRGRLGRSLGHALREAGVAVEGPLARNEKVEDPELVLLCVPERELRSAAAAVRVGALVGHCSASAPLDALAPHERFVMHPLMTVTAEGASFAGAACAIDGSSARALEEAGRLARLLAMHPVRIPAARRALYHAAASMASNFLVTLEASAERLATPCGIDRAALAPLVRAAADNWARLGAAGALTGPIARGDSQTAAQQRGAVAEAAPDLLPLWDALADATRHLAGAADGA